MAHYVITLSHVNSCIVLIEPEMINVRVGFIQLVKYQTKIFLTWITIKILRNEEEELCE